MPLRAPAPGFRTPRASMTLAFVRAAGRLRRRRAPRPWVPRRPARPPRLRGLAARPHGRRGLPDGVDQMRGRKGGQAFVSTEPTDMVEHELPAGDVEPDGRLVEQQKGALGEQNARGFD